MGFEEVKRWVIYCDGCGKYFEESHQTLALFETIKEAREAVSAWDAEIIDDDVYCDSCVVERKCEGCSDLFPEPLSLTDDGKLLCDKCLKEHQ